MGLIRKALLSGMGCTAVLVSGRGYAQAVSSPVDDFIQEIVVTAQKREQNLQKVPISVTALGEEQLAQRGITNIIDLGTAVPGLQFKDQSGILLPVLRGVGNLSNTIGNEASVAMYVDGIYFARMPSSMFELNNIQRVEILKGPQGTLFGRNATGGVINVVTKDPSHDPLVKGGFGYGRFNSYQANAYATTGISDDVAIDLALSGKTDDGFGRNITTERRYGFSDSVLARSSLLVEPRDHTKIRLSGFYSWSRQSGQKSAFPGTTTGTLSSPAQIYTSSDIGFYNANEDTDTYSRFKNWGLSLRVEQALPFARWTSISAYSKLREYDQFDGDHTPRPDFIVSIHGGVKLFTQELQLASLSGQSIDWIAGLYYYNNHSSYNDVSFIAPLLFGPGLNAPARQTALSYAAFSQATYEIAPDLRLTGGIRYTSDKTSASGEVSLNTDPPLPLSNIPHSSTTVNKVTFKLGADYRATDELMFYGSFSRGFKSGVYNILTYNSDKPTDPERIDAIEFGLKSDLFDRHLRLNIAAFNYDIGSPQVQLVKNSTIFFSNAGKSRVQGVEVEGQVALLSGLTGRFNAQYLDSQYRNYPNAPASRPDLLNGGAIALPDIDARGNRTPFAAKWTFGLGANFAVPTPLGEITVSADYYYNSGYRFEPDNLLRQDAYGVMNGQIRFVPTSKLGFRIWGKNLTGSKYAVTASALLGPAGYEWTPAAPTTYGMAIDFKF